MNASMRFICAYRATLSDLATSYPGLRRNPRAVRHEWWVSQRYGYWALGLCFGAAAALAVLAFLSLLHLLAIQPAWGLFFGAVLLTIAGMQVQAGMKASADLLVHRQS